MIKVASSLRTRALLLFAFALAAALSLTVHYAISARQERLVNAKNRVENSAQLIAAEQNRVIDFTRQFLSLTLQSREVRHFVATPECQQLLAQRLKQEPRLENIAVALPDGDIVCSAVAGEKRVNIADRAYFKKALSSPKLGIGAAIVSRSTGKWVLPFYQAIRDDAGKVQGVFVVALKLSWINGALATGHYPKGARVGLIDAQGIVLARYPDPEEWVGRNASDTAFFRKLMAHGGTGTAEEQGFDGVARVYGFAPFADTAAGPIYFWVGVARASLLADIERHAAWTLALALALLLVAFGAIWIGGELMLLRPVTALSEAARRLGQGDLSARSGLRHGGGELGRLARSFDAMAESLGSMDRVVRANRALRVLSATKRTWPGAADEQSLLEAMCRAIVDSGGYRMAWIGYAEDDPQKSIRPMASCGAEDGLLDSLQMSWSDTARGQGTPGRAIRLGVPVAVSDLLGDPGCAPWREITQRHRLASALSLPLRVDEHIIGALTLCAAEPDAFAEEEVALLGEVGVDLSHAIEARRLRIERQQVEAALAKAEQRLRQTLDGMMEGCMLVGRDWSYLYVNEAAARQGHQLREKLIGRSMLEMYPGIEQSEVFGRYRRSMEERVVQRFESPFTFADGTTEWFAFNVEPTSEGIFVLSMDITQRKLDELALTRANRALRTLSACNAQLIHASSESGLLDAICRVIVDIGGYRMAWVGIAEQDPARSVRVVAQYGRSEGYLESTSISWADTPPGRGPTGTAIRTGRVQANQDFKTNPQMAPWREAALKRGFQSSAALPLKDAGGTFGALTIYAVEPDAFTPEEVTLLQELAEDLAFGIQTLRTRAERDRIADEQRHNEERLRQSLEESIQAIAATVEMRDLYTAGHERRVSELAVAIATEMGLPQDEIQGLRLAAAIHDLGKIQVPAEILSKPGRLTPIEFQLIQQHAQAGRDILKDVRFPWPIADIVWQHHERLDGSGYPRGLKGDEILRQARILAVADVVEAMASHRPYRAALGIAAALQEVERGRGAIYDAGVVDACLRLFREKSFVLPA